MRIRSVVDLDLDEVSPTAIKAAHEYLVDNLEVQADHAREAIDWATFARYQKKTRKGTLRIVAFAKTVR